MRYTFCGEIVFCHHLKVFRASFFHGTRLKTFLRVFKGRSVSQAFCDRFCFAPRSSVSFFLRDYHTESISENMQYNVCTINLIIKYVKSGNVDKMLHITKNYAAVVEIGSIGADCSNFLFVVIIFFCVCAYTIIQLHGTNRTNQRYFQLH